jgi:hypothetical protein
MIVLADNDIIHKLACCELLPQLLIWLEVPPNQVWVLPSLQYMLRRKLKSNVGALSCLNDFLSNVQPIPEADINLMERYARLDVGERQMLAVLVKNEKINKLVTGDKRALKLINDLVQTDFDLSHRLNETQVDCLESIMLGLIDKFGFATINEKVIGGLATDGVLRLSFGSGRTQSHAVEALNSYLSEVKTFASFVAQK